MTSIPLEHGLGRLREWRLEDAPAFARYADNRKVWLNLRDGFPHPYCANDAHQHIAMVACRQPPTNMAIEVAGEVVGSIGLRLHTDVERVSAEMGYWIAEPFWGRGIGTAAVRAMTDYAFRTFELTRVFAVPFAWNPASARVLQKAGFRLEGVMRRAVIKNGQVLDQWLYAITDEDWRAW